MSRLCLLILFLGIAVRFSDCQNYNIYGNDVDCNTPSAPGSEKTRLTYTETLLEGINSLNPFKKKKNYSLERATFSDVLEEVENYLGIFPGTRWCGNGDNAKSEDDLGRYNDTDACCRAHDNCRNNIIAGEIKLNLINNGLFTRSSCACDDEFFHCLKTTSSIPSKTVGKMYFNTLGPQCFECICPTNDCNLNDKTDCEGHCDKYRWRKNNKF
ncbi:phospholipase A2-like [Nylanderia fulva]|uniref:phospholipase A2-like n=1 Tax=Nylanderia fulva TaxID=613905 RepID=UPI0010FADA04|nr:phospholipase A2-like [Nylanderia fulva]